MGPMGPMGPMELMGLMGPTRPMGPTGLIGPVGLMGGGCVTSPLGADGADGAAANATRLRMPQDCITAASRTMAASPTNQIAAAPIALLLPRRIIPTTLASLCLLVMLVPAALVGAPGKYTLLRITWPSGALWICQPARGRCTLFFFGAWDIPALFARERCTFFRVMFSCGAMGMRTVPVADALLVPTTWRQKIPASWRILAFKVIGLVRICGDDVVVVRAGLNGATCAGCQAGQLIHCCCMRSRTIASRKRRWAERPRKKAWSRSAASSCRVHSHQGHSSLSELVGDGGSGPSRGKFPRNHLLCLAIARS